jgi:hypothetical protein
MEPINRRAFPGGSGHPSPDPIKPSTSPWSSSSKAKAGRQAGVEHHDLRALPWPAIASIAHKFEVSAETSRKWPLLLHSSRRDDAALACARDDHADTPLEPGAPAFCRCADGVAVFDIGKGEDPMSDGRMEEILCRR